MIRPLRGYAVTPDAAGRVAAPVAEDLSPEERERILDDSPDSALALVGDTTEAHARARAYLERVTSDGTFRPATGWWIYQIAEGDRTQAGVVAEVAVTAYEDGRILRHEYTMAEVATRIADALETVGGSAHPVSLVYRHRPAVDDIVARAVSHPPDIRVARGDRIQQAWRLTDDDDGLSAALAPIERLYIADGHHRTAGAAELARRTNAGPEDPRAHFLAVLFPDDQMRTLGYYRCLHLPTRSPSGVLAEIAAHLEIEPMDRPGERDSPDRGEIWVVAEHEWHTARLPDLTSRGPTAALDAARLQHQILGPICDVADPRTDPRLSYVPGSLGYSELEAVCGARGGLGFVTRPADVGDVMAVADAGGVLPPKSTWFTPKIGAGLFLRRFDGQTPAR